MKNRFIIAVISTTLLLSVCACANSKEKKDEKVVHKKKETMEVKQDAVSLPEEAETKPVADATLSDLYTDEELLAYANNHLADYWHTYYCFMAGTYSIGCASILAKVSRDETMNNLPEEYQKYKISKNKGYGTKEHLEAIEKYGPSDKHRFTFEPIKSYNHK